MLPYLRLLIWVVYVFAVGTSRLARGEIHTQEYRARLAASGLPDV
jgi:hypothetical protein